MRYQVALCVALAFAGACSAKEREPLLLNDGDAVRVVRAIKGDELQVEKAGRSGRVRLLGVQAFSAVLEDAQIQALSAGAVAAVESLVKGRDVTVAFDATRQDESGRYLAYVAHEGGDLGLRLIEQGWAVVYTEFPFAREAAYLEAERKARSAGRNLWGFAPAADLIKGLRRQWAEVRKGAGGAPPPDPLVAGAALP